MTRFQYYSIISRVEIPNLEAILSDILDPITGKNLNYFIIIFLKVNSSSFFDFRRQY